MTWVCPILSHFDDNQDYIANPSNFVLDDGYKLFIYIRFSLQCQTWRQCVVASR